VIRIGIALAFFLAAAGSAAAQRDPTPFEALSGPTVGGSGATPKPETRPFAAAAGTELLRHRSFTGRPCLDVGGYARPHHIDVSLYDHVISAVNGCPQRIELRVCYYRTQDCIPMEVPGNGHKEAILGTLPSTKDFRFEFREKF